MNQLGIERVRVEGQDQMVYLEKRGQRDNCTKWDPLRGSNIPPMDHLYYREDFIKVFVITKTNRIVLTFVERPSDPFEPCGM